MTYSILLNELLKDPITYKVLASEPTVRSWVRGIQEYIKSKGNNVQIFDDSKELLK
jgi:hypothetical protein